MVLQRTDFTDVSTIGSLFIDGRFECFTLEDTCRKNKVYGKTAIWAGEYPVTVTMSQRFKREMPLLLNVPEFSGIRIHPGNTEENTDGCILVGREKLTNRIGRSREAYEALFTKIVDLLKEGPLKIAVIGGIRHGTS